MSEDLSGDAWIAREYISGRWQVEIARETGLSQAQICTRIARFCAALGYPVMGVYYARHRLAAAEAALNRYQGEFTCPVASRDPQFEMLYAHARHEHVWLLRAEGLTLEQIGNRMGVSRERVREMVAKFARRVQRATRRTRFKILKETV